MKPDREACASVMKRFPINALVFWTYPVVHQSTMISFALVRRSADGKRSDF